MAAWGVMGVTSFARSCYYRQRVRLHLGDDDARGGVCVYGRWKDGWMAVQSLQPRRRRKDSATTGDFLTRYRAAASTLRYERNSASALTVGPKHPCANKCCIMYVNAPLEIPIAVGLIRSLYSASQLPRPRRLFRYRNDTNTRG